MDMLANGRHDDFLTTKHENNLYEVLFNLHCLSQCILDMNLEQTLTKSNP
jgi:hypothetical protein